MKRKKTSDPARRPDAPKPTARELYERELRENPPAPKTGQGFVIGGR
jgi:hypothetical protein